MRFHLDEHVNHAIARGLKRREIDVTTSTDAGLISASDSQQIAYGLREGRVIFTQDDDFLVIASQTDDHAGVVFVKSGSPSIGEIVRFLSLLNDCSTNEDMRGRVEYA